MSSVPKNMLILDSVDSTNNYAMALIQKREIEGEIAVFAKEQTHGKGRRGKHWQSNKGENIILSVVAQMQWLPVSRQFELSVAASLSCYDLLSTYNLANLFIKWPNDLFINDSKAGGILIENVIKGKIWQWSVIGMGLNINQDKFHTELSGATSLKLSTGKSFDVIRLAAALHGHLIRRIEGLKAGNFKEMLEDYYALLYGRGKRVRLKSQGRELETTLIEVTWQGELVTRDVVERKFLFDEVEFRGLV